MQSANEPRESRKPAVPLIFDTREWHQFRASAWFNDDRDAVFVNFFRDRPQIPAPLSDLSALRELSAMRTASSGGGLVELDVITVDGISAIRQIDKMPL